jgi:hypothetical protein
MRHPDTVIRTDLDHVYTAAPAAARDDARVTFGEGAAV